MKPTEITGEEILKFEVSVGKTLSSPVIANLSFENIFTYLTDRYSKAFDILPSYEYGSPKYKQIKQCLPYFIPGGTIPKGSNPSDNNITPNNIFVVDIDAKDNPNVDLLSMRKSLLELIGVVGVYKSVSGKGLWVMVYSEDYKYTKQYYSYFCKLLKSKYKIIADANCSNISRKRVLSYNSDWTDYTNFGDIEPWNLKDIDPVQNNTPKNNSFDEFINKRVISVYREVSYASGDPRNDEERLRKAIDTCANHGWYEDNYYKWYYVACDCKNLPDGESLFIRISNNYPKKKDSIETIQSTYNRAKPSGISSCIGKWINRAKLYR